MKKSKSSNPRFDSKKLPLALALLLEPPALDVAIAVGRDKRRRVIPGEAQLSQARSVVHHHCGVPIEAMMQCGGSARFTRCACDMGPSGFWLVRDPRYRHAGLHLQRSVVLCCPCCLYP